MLLEKELLVEEREEEQQQLEAWVVFSVVLVVELEDEEDEVEELELLVSREFSLHDASSRTLLVSSPFGTFRLLR